MAPVCNGHRHRVFRSLGLNNGGEIASVDLKPTVSTETSSDRSPPAKAEVNTAQGPLAPIPSLLTEDQSSKHDASDRSSTLPTRPKSASSSPVLNHSRPALPLLTAKDHPSKVTESPGQPAPSDPNITPSGATSPTSARSSSRIDTDNAPALLDSLAALLPCKFPIF